MTTVLQLKSTPLFEKVADVDQPAEIWAITGSHWTLPVRVEHHNDLALVSPADIPLLPKQVAALRESLSAIAIGGETDAWVIPTLALRDIGEPAQVETEDIVEWRRKPQDKAHAPNHPGVDEFVTDWLVSTGMLQSKATAIALYSSFCTHMLHWLVNKQKPVNLMFCEIFAVPYRRNWKEICYGKAYATRDVRLPWYQRLNEDVPTEYLAHPDVAAWNPDDQICEWNLDIISDRWFRTTSNEAERKRRLRSKNSYLRNVVRNMIRQIPYARRIFTDFMEGLRQRTVALPRVRMSDCKGAVISETPKPKHNRYAARTLVVPAVLGPEQEEESIAAEMARAYRQMQAMSRVSRGDTPMRAPGPDMEKSAHQTDGTNGVPVLDATQGGS